MPWRLIGIPVYVYIPKFYTDVVGINVALLGYILFSVRIFDAVTDPLIGYLSDHTNTRFGRRRPYIAGGGRVRCRGNGAPVQPAPGQPRRWRPSGSVSAFMPFFCSGRL